jgi:hypothetical protein
MDVGMHIDLHGTGFVNRAAFYAWKVFLMLCVVGIVSICYFGAAKLTAHRQNDLMTSIDRAIPFVPWSWWFYFPGYLAGLTFSVLVMQDLKLFHRALVAIILAQTLCTIGFFILPSTFPRPTEAPPGLTGDCIRWFWTVDPPNDTFPSKHVAISLLTAMAVFTEGIWPKWISGAFALGVVITVHTTKQHYLADTFGGIAVASFSYWLVFRYLPRRAERRVGAPPPPTASDSR